MTPRGAYKTIRKAVSLETPVDPGLSRGFAVQASCNFLSYPYQALYQRTTRVIPEDNFLSAPR